VSAARRWSVRSDVSLIAGIVEFGSAWNRSSRWRPLTPAPAGSSLGSTRLADYGLLQGVKSALAGTGRERDYA
jgi:hypothetical protein